MTKPKPTGAAKLSNMYRNPADFFLVKFYENILNNPECEHICSWAPDGHCMIVYDKTALINELKNRQVCKQNDYSSFARQMRIYRWRKVRVDDSGNTPWPEDAKVWRHPVLHRDSTEEEVADAVRTAPAKGSIRPRKDSAKLGSEGQTSTAFDSDGGRFLPVPPLASTSSSLLDPMLDPALRGEQAPQPPTIRPTLVPQQAASAPAPSAAPRRRKEVPKAAASRPNASAVSTNGAGVLPSRRQGGIGFYEDDMLFGGVEEDGSDDDQLLSRSPESQAMRALRIEMSGVGRTGPRAPAASDHLARIDLTKLNAQDLTLPPIPPMSMALEDFPEQLYYNSNMVMEHAATNPMNFDHPWAALSQISKIKAPPNPIASSQPVPAKDISVPILS